MTPENTEEFFALHSVELDVGFGSPRRQSRVTVAFRGLLVLPHVLVLFVLSVVAVLLMSVGWFAALFLGRLPRWIAVYEMSVIAYSLRVTAYGYMLVNEFPPFSLSRGGDYPLRIEIGASRLSRLKVLFRWLLVIPAAIAGGLARNGLFVFSPILWIVTLVLGRMPQPLFNAAAAVVRFDARLYAYYALVTDSYPRKLFGDEESDFAPEGPGRELRVQAARGLVWLLLVLGVAAWIGSLVLDFQSGQKAATIEALQAAEDRFASSARVFQASVHRCPTRPKALACLEAQTRSFADAFDRFSDDVFDLPGSATTRVQGMALSGEAARIARELRRVSRAKTASAFDARLREVERSIVRFDTDNEHLARSLS